MKKSTFSLLALTMLPSCLQAQRIQQPLGRSVVAVTSGTDVLVSWRKLAQEQENCSYNLYKRTQGSTDYTKVNSTPITKTNFQTTISQIPYGSELAVTIVSGDKESEKSNPYLFQKQEYRDVFFDFNFETSILNPNNYKAKYAWPMDLDGNGEFDAVLVDRLHSGTGTDPGCSTTSHKLQAYTLDGKCLWTIDMGPNVSIDAGQNDLVVAYDINGDGKCEVIIKSSDMTRFWDSTNNTWGKYANGSSKADTDGDGIEDYTTQTVRNPPFYISIVNARTGEEIDCAELDYSQIKDSKDTYSRDNRADYMNDGNGTEYAFLGGKFAIAYFDGTHPSLAVQCYNRNKTTGHHYYVCEWKYDWNNGKAANWHHDNTWSMNDALGDYDGEFHQMRVGDVDGDGIDEVMEGGYIMNPSKGLVTHPHIHHGDRFDLSDIDPDRPGMEVFAIQQSNLLGQVLYDAATGEHIKEWYLSSVTDVGRGRCIDVDADHKGYEIFSTMSNLYDCKGNVIKEGSTTYPYEASWWDGDLQRELISSPGGNGYGSNVNISKYGGTRLIEFSKESNWAVHAGGAIRPAYMGDMTGDWREEVILMKQNADTSTGLVGYSTNIATDYSFYTLQEDPHYRLDCTTRGYYQMPCTSFYLGGDMPYPPLPPTMVTDTRWQSGSTWSAASSGFTTFDQGSSTSASDGKSVVFDMSGDNSQTINISGSLKPGNVYVMTPKGHDYTFGGSGSLNGDMELWKSMLGKATFNNNMNYTGKTVVSEGTLCLNGTVAGPIDLRAKGTLAGTGTLGGDISFEGALNYEGCRLMPGNDNDTYGTLTFGKSLTIPGNVYIEVNAADGKAGKIKVNGDLTFEGENTFTINQTSIAEGKYVLAECTGTLTADASTFSARGLDGINFNIEIEGKQIVLNINGTRTPQKDVVWTGNESNVWDYKTSNFKTGTSATPFVTDDEVVFNDESGNRNITINDMMVAKSVTFNVENGTYNFSGDGGIGGAATVTKNGAGTVKMDLKNSNYTGATIINGGTLTVTNLYDGGAKSALGASTADEGNLQLNGGTLRIEADNMATDHIITLTDTATIDVAKGATSLKGKVTGSGYLIKKGSGQLNFSYAGTNPFSGLIIRGGKVAQGSWQATFGKTGSPMVLEGGEVDLIDMNNSSTRPIFNYAATVVEGTSNTIKGTTRGAVNGSFKGAGTLTIVSTGVRSDVGADFSAFKGTLNAQGENFRLMDNVTDMSGTNLVLASGAKVGHYASNSSTANAKTTKIGSLASTATDCSIGNGKDTYEVGYNNTDATYKGTLKAASIKKYGTGTWTLSSEGSTSSIEVYEGALLLNNSPLSSSPSAFTSGSLVVKNGGTLLGNGCANAVTVQKGGTVMSGTYNSCGTLKTAGNLIMQEGSTLTVRVKKNSSGGKSFDKYKVAKAITHNNDTILISVDSDVTLAAGDELRIFTGDGTQSGTYILKTVSEGRSITWDDSQLLSDGKLKVASVETGIRGIIADDTEVDVYTTDGLKVRDNVKYGEALEGLSRGVYVINGQKIIKK